MAPVSPIVLRCTFDYLVGPDDELTRACAVTENAQRPETLIEEFDAAFPSGRLVAVLAPDGERTIETDDAALGRFIETVVFPGTDELSVELGRLVSGLAGELGERRPTLRLLTDLFFFGASDAPVLGFARGQFDDAVGERFLLWDFRVRDGRARVTVDDRTATGAALKTLLSDPATLDAVSGPALLRIFTHHGVVA